MKNKHLLKTFPINIIHTFARNFIWTEHERKANDLTKILNELPVEEQAEHLFRVAIKLQKIYGKDVDFNFIEGKLAARKTKAFPKFEATAVWVINVINYLFFNKRSK